MGKHSDRAVSVATANDQPVSIQPQTAEHSSERAVLVFDPAAGTTSDRGDRNSVPPVSAHDDCDADAESGSSHSHLTRRTAAVATLSGVAFLSAVSVAAAATTYQGVGNQLALRPSCSWGDGSSTAAATVDYNYGVQTCQVWSNSMQRYITVQVRASNGTSTNGEHAIYFLDGISAPDSRNTWSFPQTGMLAAYSQSNTLVMPAGGASSWMTDWNESASQGDANSPVDEKWETFLTKELPSWVSVNYGSGVNGNALVGLSMSAGPAMNLVEKHPEIYSAVESISGFYQTANPLGYFLIPLIQSYVSNITNGQIAMWGSPYSSGNQWSANDASKNLAKLKANGQYAVVAVGNGIPTAQEYALLYANGGLANVAVGLGLELGAYLATKALQIQAFFTGAPIKFVYGQGGHDWTHWTKDMPTYATALESYIAKLPSPTSYATTVSNTTSTTAATTTAATTAAAALAATTSATTTSAVTTSAATTTPAATTTSANSSTSSVATTAPATTAVPTTSATTSTSKTATTSATATSTATSKASATSAVTVSN